MSYTTSTLTGSYKTWSGGPAAGTVEIIPNSPVLIDAEGDVILSGRVKATLDASGSFSVTLPATDDATVEPATGRQYTVVAKLRHQHLKAVTGVELAGGATVDMADVTSATETTASVSTWLTEEQYEAALALKADVADIAGFVETDDSRLSDARPPTAHTHDDRYFTEAEVTAALATKADTGDIPTTAAEVGADPAGSAAAAQTAAVADALAAIDAFTLRAVKGSTQTVNNSVTTVDDTELIVTLEAGATYEFQGYLRYESSTTADLRVGLTVPLNTTANWTAQGGSTGVASNGIGTGWWQDRDQMQTALLGGAGTGVTMAAQLVGTIATGDTAGDLKIRWAQSTAEASDTKLMTNSRLKVTRIS